ncbi:MAG: hypothetical protein HY899_16320 [Deltaproteobacteria bacterium]|nr:hypothetical protein [Deltaproteobacteria bacterium]
MKRLRTHRSVFACALACVVTATLAACGSAKQNVHVQRNVESLDSRTRFDPIEVTLPEGIDVSRETRDVFDETLHEELARRGLIGSMGPAGTLEVRPSVVSYSIEGGVDQSFFATQGNAVVTVEVVLIDRDGRSVGRLRATERSEVVGVLPKIINPALLRGAAEALAGELAAAVDGSRGGLH